MEAAPDGLTVEVPDVEQLNESLLGLAVSTEDDGYDGGDDAYRSDGNGDVSTAARQARGTGQLLHDEPITPDESNLFVGDLARGLSEDELEVAFSAHGTVAAVSIKRDRATGKNLGYGFVKMSTHDEAVAAKQAMHEAELHGRKVRVGWAQKNTSLFVGGLDDAMTTEQLRRIFSEYGPIDEEHTYVKTGKYGFAKMKYRVHAEVARKDLNSKPIVNNHPLKVEWNNVGSATTQQHLVRGVPGIMPPPGGSPYSVGPGGPGHTAHSVHIQFEGDQDPRVSEAAIRGLFHRFCTTIDVVIPRNQQVSPSPAGAAAAASPAAVSAAPAAPPVDGKSGGPAVPPPPATSASPQRRRFYGFIHFPLTPEGARGAAAAVEALNGTTYKELRVSCTFTRSPSRRPINAPGSGGSGARRMTRSGSFNGSQGLGGWAGAMQGSPGGNTAFMAAAGRPSGRGGWPMQGSPPHGIPGQPVSPAAAAAALAAGGSPHYSHHYNARMLGYYGDYGMVQQSHYPVNPLYNYHYQYAQQHQQQAVAAYHVHHQAQQAQQQQGHLVQQHTANVAIYQYYGGVATHNGSPVLGGMGSMLQGRLQHQSSGEYSTPYSISNQSSVESSTSAATSPAHLADLSAAAALGKHVPADMTGGSMGGESSGLVAAHG